MDVSYRWIYRILMITKYLLRGCFTDPVPFLPSCSHHPRRLHCGQTPISVFSDSSWKLIISVSLASAILFLPLGIEFSFTDTVILLSLLTLRPTQALQRGSIFIHLTQMIPRKTKKGEVFIYLLEERRNQSFSGHQVCVFFSGLPLLMENLGLFLKRME